MPENSQNKDLLGEREKPSRNPCLIFAVGGSILSPLIILLVFPLSCAAVVAVVIVASFPRFVLIHAFIADYVGSPLFRARLQRVRFESREPKSRFLKRQGESELERESKSAQLSSFRIRLFAARTKFWRQEVVTPRGNPPGKPPIRKTRRIRPTERLSSLVSSLFSLQRDQ